MSCRFAVIMLAAFGAGWGGSRWADLDGPGCIHHIWITLKKPGQSATMVNRKIIMRIYFDGATVPHVEAPVGDFFRVMHGVDWYDVNTFGTASRRSLFGRTLAAASGTAVVSQLPVARGAHAAGKEQIRIALVGCGGRGTGAAFNALFNTANVKLVSDSLPATFALATGGANSRSAVQFARRHNDASPCS